MAGYGLYIHIPYCHSRCAYCDFYTNPGSRAVPQGYIDAVLRDFEKLAPKDAGGEPLRPQTVYFGGGTPSLLAPAQVRQVLCTVRPQPGAEVTLECNPESAEEEKLQAHRAAGVNRLSLGVQTARDESLRALGRPHRAEDARRALAAARAAGFENISGDIMMALPGYSRGEFDETLGLLAEGGAVHISAYLLKVEEGTRLAQSLPPGLPSADEAAEFYLYAVERLAVAGFGQYEISNFARPGYEGRHNLLYWDAQNWLGLGAAAHSCLFGRRFSFACDAKAYVQGELSSAEEGTMDANDYLMLRLRLAEGVAEEELANRYGVELTKDQQRELSVLQKAGLARRTPSGWALTPQGMLVQNAILARLLG